MIIDTKPVADVRASAIKRKWFILVGIQDGEGNQLLGELIWAVVVGAI
jgi:hypothetical protein